MATKKATPKEARKGPPQPGDPDFEDHPPEGAWPGDPDYQRMAAPTRSDLEVLDKGPEARAAAIAKDYKKMGVPR